ncbi:MAG: hypothetical protein QM479_11180 [Pseudomonadota bacterium]
MKKYKTALLFFIVLFSLNLVYAASITQRGSIALISLEKRKIIIDIEVNNIKLLSQTHSLDFSHIRVWWNNKRLDIGRLRKGMKIEFRSKKGKIYSIRVLDNNGHNLEPLG